MEPDPGRGGAPVPLACATRAVGIEGLTGLSCLGCRGPLDVHQPDADLPHRMLGTCPACKRWHLVDAGADDQLLVVLLPDARAVVDPGAADPS